jgi:alcohol dehydrogenase (NADP+)
MLKTIGYAAFNPQTPLAPFNFERRELLPSDVRIEILYCGVCHTDIHQARNEWGGTTYPVVPGHEIVGRVTAVGNAVKKFKVGNLAGVGCLVDSCKHCADCKDNLEQFCPDAVFTYNSPDKHTGKVTYGGYSKQIVVDEDFVLRISDKLSAPEKLAAVAPLLCAGITTYSPMRHWNVGKGDKVGIVGLGGLGHMGVKWAHAFGAHTVLFTTSPNKKDDAIRMGADEVVISKNPDEMKKHLRSFDFILNTVAAPNDQAPFLELLKRDGILCLVGVPDQPHPPIHASAFVMQRRSLTGSLIGGLKETQEMLDFSAEHDIVCDIEMISMQQIDQAYERMLKSDVKYRFVIDMATLR